MKPKSDEPKVAVATKDDAVAEKGAAPSAEPLVSVVIPSHNTDRYLAQALERVLGQLYSNWELIFLNNRSTEGSLEIDYEVYGCRPMTSQELSGLSNRHPHIC